MSFLVTAVLEITECFLNIETSPTYLAAERRLKLKYFLTSLFRFSAHKACVLLSSRSVFYEQIFIELHYIQVRVKDMFKRPLEWPFTKQVCWVLCHCSVGEGWGRMGRLLCLHWLHDTAHFARTRIHLRLIGLREFLWTNPASDRWDFEDFQQLFDHVLVTTSHHI